MNNQDRILELSGEELEIEVSTIIFESPELWYSNNVVPKNDKWYHGPSFTKDYSSAMMIVERIEDLYNLFEFELSLNDDHTWDAMFWLKNDPHQPIWATSQKTMQDAICKAALLALEISIKH